MQTFLSFARTSLLKSSNNIPLSPFSQPGIRRSLTNVGGKSQHQLLTSPFHQSYITSDVVSKYINHSFKRRSLAERFSNTYNVTKMISNTHLIVQSRRGFSHWSSHWSYRVRRSWRSFMPDTNEVVLGLIGINFGVLLLWRIGNPFYMLENFTVSMENFRSGRVHTLLTSTFSHRDLGHLITNMFGLYFFGSHISQIFGPLFLLKLYVGGGIVGSVFFLLHDAFVNSSSRDTFRPKTYALGASGAVNAIILLNVFLFPKATHYLNLVVPVPAPLSAAILIGTDVWRAMQPNSEISGAAHLGGAFVAALVWARIKKRWI